MTDFSKNINQRALLFGKTESRKDLKKVNDLIGTIAASTAFRRSYTLSDWRVRLGIYIDNNLESKDGWQLSGLTLAPSDKKNEAMVIINYSFISPTKIIELPQRLILQKGKFLCFLYDPEGVAYNYATALSHPSKPSELILVFALKITVNMERPDFYLGLHFDSTLIPDDILIRILSRVTDFIYAPHVETPKEPEEEVYLPPSNRPYTKKELEELYKHPPSKPGVEVPPKSQIPPIKSKTPAPE
jgi:hypothetical protein